MLAFGEQLCSTAEAHHLNHLVGCDIGEGLDFREEAAAADVELLGQEVDRQRRIGHVLDDDMVHLREEFVVEVVVCQRLDGLGRLLGEAAHELATSLDEVAQAGIEILHGERLLDECVGTHLHALGLGVVVGLGGKHDEWDVAGVAIGTQTATELCTVHLRHHPVADDERHGILAELLQRLDAVDGGEHGVVLCKVAGKEGEQVGIVFDDEDGRRRPTPLPLP